MTHYFGIIVLIFISITIDSANCATIDFSSLAYTEGHSPSYTLVCLERALIPEIVKIDSSTTVPEELLPVKDWLNQKTLTNFLNKAGRVKLSARKLTFRTREYFLVRLFTERCLGDTERFVSSLWGGGIKEAEGDEFSSAMIIFNPQDGVDDHVVAYLLGSNWSQLYNPYAVVHEWGLRLAATSRIFSDESIKSIFGKNNFDPNPSTRKEKKHSLAPIESFALEVGTEGLLSLSLLPRYELVKNSRCKRLVEGADTFKFSLAPPTKERPGHTLEALFSMADYLYSISKNYKTAHRKLKPFIDDEETDKKIIAQLSKRLIGILRASPDMIFPADEIWKLYGSSPIFPIDTAEDNNDFFLAIQKIKSLEDPISIRKHNSKSKFNEPLGRLIYTLPFALKPNDSEGTFYRFDRGRYFKVADSKFSKIIYLLRSPEVKITLESLLDYLEEDARKAEKKATVKDVDYKESNYNKRVVNALPSSKAVLLDRINILLGGAGNLFEFGDMLLCGDKGEIYIVHVKRKEAGDIDHHRTQVERCAEYLGSQLNKENAQSLLLEGCVKGLYTKFKISINKVKGQDKRLTHGKYFLNLKPKEKEETYKKYLERILSSKKSEEKTNKGKLKASLRKIDLEFFKDHLNELIITLDALYDCATESKVSEADILDFVGAMKEMIRVRQLIFPSGVVKGDVRKKIHIIMAVIDDRKIDKIIEAEKYVEKAKASKTKKTTKKSGTEITLKQAEKELKEAKADTRESETALFHKQHLWGLDRTRQFVQKYNFRFNLVIINETPREGWDSFGPLIAEEPDDDETSSTDSSGEESDDDSAKVSDSSSEDGSADDSASTASDIKVRDYEYNSTDINRLLHNTLKEGLGASYSRFSLSGGDISDDADTADIVHKINARYVVPPIVKHGASGPYDQALDLLAEHFFTHPTVMGTTPQELIIPLNPGGTGKSCMHWVILHIKIPAAGDISIKYIDSLDRDMEDELKIIMAFLRGKFCRKVTAEHFSGRIQPDGVSCGAVAVENIKQLFKGEELAEREALTDEAMLAIKQEHRAHLQTRDFDFDF